jgi:photosystem II stability/assembly factor-like uncharacterized protein
MGGQPTCRGRPVDPGGCPPRRMSVFTVVAVTSILLGGTVGVGWAGSRPSPGWHAQKLPSAISIVWQLSCPSVSHCVGISGGRGPNLNAIYTANGGRSWAISRFPGTVPELGGVSCPSASRCWAAGASTTAGWIDRSDDGGRTWNRQILLRDIGILGMGSITCPSVTQCLATGSDHHGRLVLFTTSDGWATWRQTTRGIASVTCASGSACWAVTVARSGEGILESADGGRTWSREGVPALATSGGIDLACPSVADCIATVSSKRSAIMSTTNGGKSWSLRRGPRAPAGFAGVACAAASACWVVTYTGAGTISYSADLGRTWRLETTPRLKSGQDLYGLTCASAKVCWAVGRGVILATVTGGA